MTGGIGSGKSSVTALLAGRGAVVNDAEAPAHRIVESGLNVREVAAIVQGREELTPVGVSRKARDKDADTKAFEKELMDLLGLKVEIKRGSGESGHLIIKFGNFDQLGYIRQRITG